MQFLHPQGAEIPFVIFETVSDDPIRFCDTTGPLDFDLGVQNRYLPRVFRFSQSRLSPQFPTIEFHRGRNAKRLTTTIAAATPRATLISRPCYFLPWFESGVKADETFLFRVL